MFLGELRAVAVFVRGDLHWNRRMMKTNPTANTMAPTMR